MTGSLRDALEDLATEARPVDLAPRVAHGVRRRRQRRLAVAGGLATLLVAATAIVVTRPAPDRGGLVTPPTTTARPVVTPDAYDVVWFEVHLGGVTKMRGRTVGGSTEDLAELPAFIPGTGDLSPDGRRVALVQETGIVVVELLTGQRTELRTPPNDFSNFTTVSWAPDSRRLAVSITDSAARAATTTPSSAGVYVVDTVSGEHRRIDREHAEVFVAWSPDGTQLALSRWDRHLPGRFGYDVVTVDGELVRSHPGAGWVASNHAWSPDGRRLVVGDSDAGARVVDVVTGEVEATLRPVAQYVWRDDAHVACHCRPGTRLGDAAFDPQPDDVIEKDLGDNETGLLVRIIPGSRPDVVEVLMRGAS